MSPYLVMLTYGGAVALAVLLLYFLGPRAWYLHLVSLAIAFTIGFVPPPQVITGPIADLVNGFVIIFLLFWGLGGLLALSMHREKHA